MTVSPRVEPRLLVDPPLRTPPPFGLWSLLTFRTTEDPHWQLGVEWESIGCAPLAPALRQGCRPDESEGFPKQFGIGATETIKPPGPFTVYGTCDIMPVGRTLAEGQEIATARLLQGEEQAVCDRLVGFVSDGLGVLPVSDPAVALGRLELILGRSGGLLIMDRLTATVLGSLALISADGGRMTTEQGTPVILSATPSEPEGLILAVGPLAAYRSEIFTSSNRVGDLLDTSINEFRAIAERTYQLLWDPCGVGASVADLGTGGDE